MNQREAVTPVHKIMQNRSGASLIFVLGAMLMLMAIGVSVLAAASSNVGIKLSQKEHNQILVLSEAVHNNIMHSLQHNTSDPQLLSHKIVMALCKENDKGQSSGKGISSFELDIELEDESDFNKGNIRVNNITLSFPIDEVSEKNAGVNISAPISALYSSEYSEEANGLIYIFEGPREPKRAEVNITMVVTVEIVVAIKAEDENEDDIIKKTVKTRAIYSYKDGKLTDDPGYKDDPTADDYLDYDDDDALSKKTFYDEGIEGPNHDPDFYKHEFVFETDGYGEWEMIKYEKLDL